MFYASLSSLQRASQNFVTPILRKAILEHKASPGDTFTSPYNQKEYLYDIMLRLSYLPIHSGGRAESKLTHCQRTLEEREMEYKTRFVRI